MDGRPRTDDRRVMMKRSAGSTEHPGSLGAKGTSALAEIWVADWEMGCCGWPLRPGDAWAETLTWQRRRYQA